MIIRLLSLIAVAFLSACSTVGGDPTTVIETKLVRTAIPTFTAIEPPVTELPDDVVLTLSREGGFAGVQETWTFFADDRSVLPSGEPQELPEGTFDSLILSIAENEILSLEPKPGTPICCDFFSYTVQLQGTELNKSITYSEGDPDSPENFWAVVGDIQQVIENQETN